MPLNLEARFPCRRLRSKYREVGFGYTVKLVWLRLVPRPRNAMSCSTKKSLRADVSSSGIVAGTTSALAETSDPQRSPAV